MHERPAPSSPDGNAAPGKKDADPEQDAVDAIRNRWLLAFGFVTWLASVIAPAISFNVQLSLESSSGAQFQAFFLILTSALFLIAWRCAGRMPLWLLAVLGAASVGLFVTYSLAKDSWTCAYYAETSSERGASGERLTMGTELLPSAREALKTTPPLDSSCESLLEIWGGDAADIWEWNGLVTRFLTLFGLYAAAWLSLALLVWGSIRRSFEKTASP